MAAHPGSLNLLLSLICPETAIMQENGAKSLTMTKLNSCEPPLKVAGTVIMASQSAAGEHGY